MARDEPRLEFIIWGPLAFESHVIAQLPGSCPDLKVTFAKGQCEGQVTSHNQLLVLSEQSLTA